MDGIDYFAYSLEIRNLGELPKNWPIGNNGWPSFMGIILSILPTGNFFDFVNFYKISSVVISTITIIPIYFISSKFFGRYLGLLGASLFAFEPKLIINSTTGMTEPIYILLFTLIILLFFYNKSKTIIISFALVAILTHIRYEALIFIIPCTILFFLNYGKQNKYIKKYIICLTIFLLVLIPFLVLNYVTTGHDGISNHYFSAIIQEYDQLVTSDFSENVFLSDEIDNENKNINYVFNGFKNTIKFLGLSLIPFFILLVPYGIFCIFRKREFRKNIIITLSFFIILPVMYAYLNGFNDIRYFFIFYPIFIFLSLFSLQIIKNKIKKQNMFFIIILLIFISIGLFSNLEEKEEIQILEEYFFVSQKVSDIATGYNEFSPAGQYIKPAELENRWPNSSIATQSGHIVRETVLITYDEHETLKEFIKNSRDIKMKTHPHHQFWFTDSSGARLLDPFYYFPDGAKKEMPIGLSHLIVDDRMDRPEFIQDIYYNEDEYPFLIKKFDSMDFDLKYNVKIFEIDYEKFDSFLIKDQI